MVYQRDSLPTENGPTLNICMRVNRLKGQWLWCVWVLNFTSEFIGCNICELVQNNIGKKRWFPSDTGSICMCSTHQCISILIRLGMWQDLLHFPKKYNPSKHKGALIVVFWTCAPKLLHFSWGPGDRWSLCQGYWQVTGSNHVSSPVVLGELETAGCSPSPPLSMHINGLYIYISYLRIYIYIYTACMHIYIYIGEAWQICQFIFHIHTYMIQYVY